MHTKKELDLRLAQAGIQPLKKLGQNFLVNPQICTAIVAKVEEFHPASVVEIGPGLGALTDELAAGPWTTLLVEMDSGLVKYWQKMAPKISIVHQDALEVRWSDLDLKMPVVLVSNLPYSIAASLVVDLSGSASPYFSGLVLMFQKEVAERIEAATSSSEYGMLSVMAQAHWKIQRVVDAGPQDFFPVPHVGSRVLAFEPLKTDHDRPAFLRFVKAAFSQRRKKLATNLGSGFSKDQIAGAYKRMGLKEDTRAQELSPGLFQKLYRELSAKSS